MLTFHQTMDPHSLDLRRDGKYIGMLQWHPQRPARIELQNDTHVLNLYEAEQCIEKYKEIKP